MTFGTFISTRRKELKQNLRDTAKYLKIAYGYSQAKAPEPAIQEIEEKETGTTTPESDTAKILELLKNPETAALLKQIVSAL
ncbi:hypothetical protein [Pseudoflavonifractor phocaeensis]|uniref:hypothetical protein n=1 Tax=Pseudoflavonifractor phocaeensis TaxID=1870988 RepID=UPI0019589824|nr:hypothetical protein [Pseudoflavonifractor phocaeensis]MBM6722406.1 hypothetical protein [Pseudoflavonifractor phocaeensis]